jgi:hypothetical protein
LSSEINPPLKVIKIDVLNVGEKDREDFEDKIIQIIKQNYEGHIKTNNSLELFTDKNKCSCIVKKSEGFFVLRSTIVYEQVRELKSVLEDDLQFYDFSGIIQSSLPSKPSTTFTVFIPAAAGDEHASSLVEQYSDQLSRFIEGIGVVRGFVFSIFDSGVDDELSDRFFFLSPLSSARSDERRIEEILSEIERLAVYTSELLELHGRSKNFFSVLEIGEGEISERVESYLWKLLSPEPVELQTLESWLSYIMERGSTVSAMVGNMKINYMEARSIAFKVENLFNRLNERSFKDYPRNFELEAEKYSRIVRNFENYSVRSEALKSRLETAMEEIRTYLSLQQQKLAMEEQKSSNEQLVRLVNLQEIFHKVEIFIVAVYITEMARTVFEALVHEMVNLLTALFIPIALVLAIGISRILHKE